MPDIIKEVPKDEAGWIDFFAFSEHLIELFDLRIINYLGNELPSRVRDCICDVLIEPFWNFKLVEIKGKEIDQNRLYPSELKAFRLTGLGQKVLSIVMLSPQPPSFLSSFFNLN